VGLRKRLGALEAVVEECLEELIEERVEEEITNFLSLLEQHLLISAQISKPQILLALCNRG
jgi:hypothetical protein